MARQDRYGTGLMARYTSAYSSFVGRLAEVENLRYAAAIQELRDAVANRQHINALCRGAIVLLSAHLEAYIRELGEILLIELHQRSIDRSKLKSRFFYHLSKHALDEIQTTSDHDKIAEKVFAFIAKDLGYWDRSGCFPNALPAELFNKGFSNPTFNKIKTYLNRFGYEEYKAHLSAKLKSEYNTTINMVDHLVDTRNKIAHGDSSISKTPDDLEDMIKIIKKFCAVTDDVFGAWCRDKLCSIR
jgi:hypothetical protein